MINNLKNKFFKNKNHSKVYLIGLITLILDQITKLLIMNNLILGQEIKIIPNFFSLLYVTNTGAAFSSFSNYTSLLIIASVFCIALVMTIIDREEYKNKFTVISLGILIGGMLGNLLDRIFYKNVIDFISLTFFSYKFPVFNVADICITLGVTIYLLINLKDEYFAFKDKIERK